MKNGLMIAALLALGSSAMAKTSPDAAWIKGFGQGGVDEVALGKLAATKGSSSAVRGFGSRMVKDHSAAGAKLASIAKTRGVSVPTTPDAGGKAMWSKLSKLKGKAFDTAYITGMVAGHTKVLGLVKQEAAYGKDPAVMSFAKSVEPTVEMHLGMAKMIAAAKTGKM